MLEVLSFIEETQHGRGCGGSTFVAQILEFALLHERRRGNVKGRWRNFRNFAERFGAWHPVIDLFLDVWARIRIPPFFLISVTEM
jgi:hypothetical protein